MPTLLPPHLAQLTKARNDNDLLTLLSANTDSAMEFLELAGGDETWAEKHSEFMKLFVKWLTGQELDERGMKRVRETVWRDPALFKSFLWYDLKLKSGEGVWRVNSLLLSSGSSFFNERVRTQERVIHVEPVDPQTIEKLLETVHLGTSDLWRLTQEEIEALLKLARKWEFLEIAQVCEQLLPRFLNLENALTMVASSFSSGWLEVAKAACRFYNEREQGFTVEVNETGELKVSFNDLKGITLKAYETLAPLTHILQFTGCLTEDPLFLEVIRKTPKFKGLDISGTKSPPPFLLEIPSSIELLNLSRCFWLNDEHFVSYLNYFTRLTRLYLAEAAALTYHSWGELPLRGLTELDLTRCKQITTEDFPIILQAVKDLLSLSLAECSKIAPQALLTLFRNAYLLNTLNLDKTAIDDAGLSEIASRFKQLYQLDLSRSPAITDLGLSRLLRALPSLQILHLKQSRIGLEKIQELEKKYPNVKFDY